MASSLIRNALLGMATPMSNLAIGYKNNILIGDQLFPLVPCDSRYVVIPEYGKGNLRIYRTERAPRADTKVIQPDTLSTHIIELEEHTFNLPLDYREIDSAKRVTPNFIQRHTRNSMDSLLLEREYLIADMVQDTTNMASGHYATLASSTDKWDNAASHPNTNIQTGINKLLTKGVMANTIIFGASAWLSYVNHADIITALFGTGARVPITPQMIADYWSKGGQKYNVVVGQSFFEAEDGTITSIWSDNCLIAYVSTAPGSANIDEPSAGYTLYYQNPTGIINTMERPDQKGIWIQPTLESKIVLLMQNAIYLINDTNT